MEMLQIPGFLGAIFPVPPRISLRWEYPLFWGTGGKIGLKNGNAPNSGIFGGNISSSP